MDESAEDRSLGEVLRTLKRVDAPADFGFKVKARIAQGGPAITDGKSWWSLPVYVYPLVIVLVVAGAFIFFYRPGGEAVPAVADRDKTVPAKGLQRVPNNEEVAVSNGNSNPGSVAPVASPERAKSEGVAPRGGSKDQDLISPPGGSKDSALANPQQLFPQSFNLNAKRPIGPPPTGNSQASISVVLGFLGLDTRFEGESMKITSVRGGSVAEKTGLKAGDIIQAVDGKPINSTSKLGSRFDAKTFTVRRGDETLQLDIRAQ